MNHTIRIRPATNVRVTMTESFTEGGLLTLASGVDVALSDLHGDYLRSLIAQAANLLARIEPQQHEPTELKHPGTWLPGDTIETTDSRRWVYKRVGNGEWPAYKGDGYLIDSDVDTFVQFSAARIIHLVPRGGESA